MNVPQNLLYTKEHEWIKIEGNQATMGITDYAQGSLGDITYVELPREGQDVKQFGEVCTVESVKAASSVYAPVSGKIKKVNKTLQDKPELINKSPYEDGWFAVIEISGEEEKKKLLEPAAYLKHVEESSK
jgi:glycine cleavage system H protein